MEAKQPDGFSLQGEDAELFEKLRQSMKLLHDKESKEQVARRIYEEIAMQVQREKEARERLDQNLLLLWSKPSLPVEGSASTQRGEVPSHIEVPSHKLGMYLSSGRSNLPQPIEQRWTDYVRPSEPPVAPPPASRSLNLIDSYMGQVAHDTAQTQRPVAQAQRQGPVYKESFFSGIWDISFSDGARSEVALIASNMNRKFSYANAAMDHTSWGRWGIEEIPNGFPMLFITREGFYPSKLYGLLWNADLPQPSDEVWSITGINGDVVYFPGEVSMTRRTADLAATASRIAYVQAESKRADVQAMSNAKIAIAQRETIMRFQAGLQGIIDRHRTYY